MMTFVQKKTKFHDDEKKNYLIQIKTNSFIVFHTHLRNLT